MKKIILSAAFLGLGVFGFAQQTDQPKRGDFQHEKGERLQQMKSELNLSDAQVAQLKALHEKNKTERKQDMQAKRQERMQKMKENDAEMQKILTQDQYKKFQEMRAKKMAERKENFREKRHASPNEIK